MSIRLHMKYPTEHTEAASSIARRNYRSDPANVKIDNPIMSAATDETGNISFYYSKYDKANMQSVNLEVTYPDKYTVYTQEFQGFICRNAPDQDSIFLEFTGTIYRPHKITGAINEYTIIDSRLCSDRDRNNILRNIQDPNTFNLTFKDRETHVIKIYGFKLNFADASFFPNDTE